MSGLNTSSKKYLSWIDYSKGISILVIVLFHFFQNYRDGSTIADLLYKAGSSLAFIAVDIFFVIAGFNTTLSLLKQVNQNPENFKIINWFSWLKKRLIRLYPTYWLAIIVTLIMYLILGKRIEIKSFSDFILIAIGWPDYARYKTLNPGFWFFSAILQGYLIIPFIFLICKNRPILILNLGIGLGIITKIFCLVSIANNFIPGYSLIQNNWILSYIFPLCLGLYWGFIYFKKDRFRLEDWLYSFMIFAIGLVIYAAFWISSIDTLYMLGFDIVFTPLMVLLCYWISNNIIETIPKFNQGIAILGKNSYQIYLLHQPLFFILLPTLIQSIKLSLYPRLIISVLITALVLSVYILLFNKIEFYFNKLFFKIKTIQ